MRPLLALFGLLAGCAGPTLYERGPLIEQLLRPRPGFTGRLTNEVCREFDGDRCARADVAEYDMRTEPGREQLRAVKLICSVAGERFRVCRDRPGLCQQEEKVIQRFLGIPTKRALVERRYISIEEGYQQLLDAGTFCAAQESDLGREMFR